MTSDVAAHLLILRFHRSLSFADAECGSIGRPVERFVSFVTQQCGRKCRGLSEITRAELLGALIVSLLFRLCLPFIDSFGAIAIR